MSKQEGISAPLENSVAQRRQKTNKPRPVAMDVVVDGQECVLLPLTKGQWALIDSNMLEELNQWNWHSHAEYAARAGGIGSDKRHIMMHRVILNPTEGLLVDHVNGCGVDNRRSNLRVATPDENRRNRKIHPENKLGLKGVYFCKVTKKYSAQIYHNKQRIRLGYYESPELAKAAYDASAARIHGAFARLS